MNKKRDDLEAIVDLLWDWCKEYGETYVSTAIINGSGMGDIGLERPDHGAVRVYKKMDPSGGNREEVQ